jgi:toxin ParE1/3/4
MGRHLNWRTPSAMPFLPLQQHPSTGSRRIGQISNIPDLRSWRVSGFPLIFCFCLEREDFLDVVHVLGERQGVLAVLAE